MWRPLAILLVLLSFSTSPAAEIGTPTVLPPGTTADIGSYLPTTMPISATGTPATPAEQAKADESLFQQRLAPITLEVDGLSKTIAAMRTQITAPDRQDVDLVEQKITLAEQELTRAAMGQTSPIAKLQESELQDKLFNLRLSVETLKRRFGWADISVFGLDFFSSATPNEDMDVRAVPQAYRLRSGDSVRLSITSRLGGEKQYTLEVNQNGKFIAPAVGTVTAAGKTVRELETALNARYRKEFPQLSAVLSVDKMSTVAIKVAGAVAHPGTYRLSGTSTVFDALYKAGGPTAAGSLRRVSLTRDGEAKRTIDLYDFLLRGSKLQDLPLQDGDMIFVPPVGKTITVYGEVVRPGRYEPDFPLTLEAAIALAGGAKSGGFLQTISIERVENGEYKTLVSAKGTMVIQPGDQITVASIRAEKTNRVSITGPVNAPGDYGFHDGMRVSELIKAAQGLSKGVEVHMRRADILRIEDGRGISILSFDLGEALKGSADQDVKLQKLDRVFVYEPDQVEYRANYFTMTGAVTKPGTYRRANSTRVSDAIAAAGGVLPNAYLARADLIRHGDGNSRELIKISLGSALQNNPEDNIVLSDRDQITIYTFDQVRISFPTVSVFGAVQRPGPYDRADNMRVSDLLFIAGGLLPEASDMAEVSHAQPDGTLQLNKVKLNPLTPGSQEDLLLQDGDVVSVPSLSAALRSPMTVTVAGEVARPGTYTIDPHKTRLADVISRAGGLTPSADTKSLVFLRKKESFQEASQRSGLDLITERMSAFVNKQFYLQLVKMHAPVADQLVKQMSGKPGEIQKTTDVSAEELGTQPTNGSESAGSQSQEPVLQQVSTKPATAIGDRIDNGKVPQPAIANGPIVAVKPEDYGRIGVDLNQAMKDAGSKHNLILKDGDRVIVQPVPDTITVIGAVLHPHSFVAEDGKGIGYFVDKSGGYAPDASRRHVIVVRANGDAVPAGEVRTVNAGDVIYVPNTGLIDIATKAEKVSSVTKILSDILSSAFIITRF